MSKKQIKLNSYAQMIVDDIIDELNDLRTILARNSSIEIGEHIAGTVIDNQEFVNESVERIEELMAELEPKQKEHLLVVKLKFDVDCLTGEAIGILQGAWKLKQHIKNQDFFHYNFAVTLEKVGCFVYFLEEVKKITNINSLQGAKEIIDNLTIQANKFYQECTLPLSDQLKRAFLLKVDKAKIAFLAHDIAAAKQLYLEAMHIYPNYQIVLEELLEIYFKEGKFEEVLKYSNKLLQINSNNTYALLHKIQYEKIIFTQVNSETITHITKQPIVENFHYQLTALCILNEFQLVLDFYELEQNNPEALIDKEQVFKAVAFAAYKLRNTDKQKEFYTKWQDCILEENSSTYSEISSELLSLFNSVVSAAINKQNNQADADDCPIEIINEENEVVPQENNISNSERSLRFYLLHYTKAVPFDMLVSKDKQFLKEFTNKPWLSNWLDSLLEYGDISSIISVMPAFLLHFNKEKITEFTLKLSEENEKQLQFL